MKIKIEFPEDGFEASFEAYDAEGRRIPTPRHILIRPLFYDKDPVSRALNCTVSTESGEVVQRAIMTANGRRGKIRIQDRTRPIVPPCEAPDDKPADKVAAEVGKLPTVVKKGGPYEVEGKR